MTIIILSGVPGSGKSTVIKLLRTEKHTVISIDSFYKYLRETTGMKWGRELEIEAYKLLEKELEILLEQNKDIIIETTGASDKWIEIFYSLRKRNDVQVIDILLEISLEEATKRIKKRNASSYSFKLSTDKLEGWIKRIVEVRDDYEYVIDANKSEQLIIKDVLRITNG